MTNTFSPDLCKPVPPRQSLTNGPDIKPASKKRKRDDDDSDQPELLKKISQTASRFE